MNFAKVNLSLLFLTMLSTAAAQPGIDELKTKISRYSPAEIKADVTKLSPEDRRALGKLIEAAHLIDDIFLDQFWSGNRKVLADLRRDTSPLGKARLEYFLLNKSPWSALDEHKAFLPGVPEKKVPGANFYPEDMTKADFEAWVAKLTPAQKTEAQGFFSVIRRKDGQLVSVPYSAEYGPRLERLATLLKEAADQTTNASLKRYLKERAAAFLSNEYYASDVAWMDLDAPLDVTIGPYETYNDELFGYKAAFEAYITVRDEVETDKVRFFSSLLQDIENNLPIAKEYKTAKIGALAPIRVVNEVIATGDAAHGVRTAAFNLPNDERVIREKGSKRVMLKNVQEAKFQKFLPVIGSRLLTNFKPSDLSFYWFFTHILAHELTHGIGPHDIKKGGTGTPRLALKELYTPIEEAKADVSGLFMLQYMLDKKLLPEAGTDSERQMYTTFLASSFRTLRFGMNESHGRGMALQFNYLSDKGAIQTGAGGTFHVDVAKMKSAIRDLASELLTIEAEGDYSRAKAMLEKYAVLRPPLAAALERLKDVAIDINPNHVTANAIAAPK